jgi:pantoate--beta-alanine ligase
MSSRNNYLNPFQREQQGPVIYQVLQETAALIKAGDRDHAKLEKQAIAKINAAGLESDFFNIQNATDLSKPNRNDDQLVILAAAFLGKARLIDNLAFSVS